MKRPVILLIPVDYGNSRNVAEAIEAETFKTEAEMWERLRKDLQPSEDDFSRAEPDDYPKPLWYELSEFTSGVNDQELDVLDSYFMAYVYFEN